MKLSSYANSPSSGPAGAQGLYLQGRRTSGGLPPTLGKRRRLVYSIESLFSLSCVLSYVLDVASLPFGA